MSTRHAAEGSPLRQERYSSSAALDRGLNGVLVKNRCTTLSDAREVELVWFIQYQSMQQGALDKFCADLLAEFPERIGTPAMIKIGKTSDQSYPADEVHLVKDEIGSPFNETDFPLFGEVGKEVEEDNRRAEDMLLMTCHGREHYQSELKKMRLQRSSEMAALSAIAQHHPKQYSVAIFTDKCRAFFVQDMPEMLIRFCLDPAFTGLTSPVFHDLHGALLEYMERWEKKHLAKIAATQVGNMVLDAMEYSEAERALVLIEGLYGSGKTWPSKAWCEARPGKRRFVQCPSSNDNIDFFRTMAEPLGVSNALSMKAHQMRARINDVLQSGHLTLVMDESHYLFPQASTRVALPGRVNWVMTALTNYGVPVVLVATPQFLASRTTVERNTFWAGGQLDGRISRYVRLPEELEESDLRAIAQMHLPCGDEKSVTALVLYALASKKRLRGIEHGVKAARHVARRAGRSQVTFADIKQAMNENVMPSDTALNKALSHAEKPVATTGKRAGKIYITAPAAPSKLLSAPVPERDSGAALIDNSDRRSKRSIAASLSSA